MAGRVDDAQDLHIFSLDSRRLSGIDSPMRESGLYFIFRGKVSGIGLANAFFNGGNLPAFFFDMAAYGFRRQPGPGTVGSLGEMFQPAVSFFINSRGDGGHVPPPVCAMYTFVTTESTPAPFTLSGNDV
jgi:hypothetical protein